MMEWIKTWIVGVTTASVFLAAVRTLFPKGSVKRVGELACGLVLLLAVAAPLVKLDMGELSLTLTEFRMAESDSTRLLELENNRLIKEIIQEKTGAYISDKAKELGMECTAEVDYEYSEEGLAYPVSVTVKGTWNEEQRGRFMAFLERELAIPKEKQIYEEENGP